MCAEIGVTPVPSEGLVPVLTKDGRQRIWWYDTFHFTARFGRPPAER